MSTYPSATTRAPSPDMGGGFDVQHTWRKFVMAMAVLGTAYFALPSTSLSKLVLYNGVGLCSVIAILVGVRRHRPEHRLPWLLFAIGQASFLTADLCFYVMQDVLHIASPFPSVADGFYLAMYPLVIAGLVLLSRRLVGTRDYGSVLDAAIISTGMFVLLWVF